MNSLKYSFENLKIDVTKGIVVPSGGMIGRMNAFDLSPEDFLKYAKRDFEEKNERGLINSLTNVKRAIDCHIDEVFHRINIDLEKIPDSLINFLKLIEVESNLPYRLKIINALNFAPVYIISKTRKLRHVLEHHYEKPQEREVKEAIDIAELFIGAINNKLFSACTEFYISDNENYLGDFEFKNVLLIDYADKFRVLERNGDELLNKKELGTEDISYFALIRLINSIDDEIEIGRSFRILMELIEHPVPNEQVNLSQN